MAAKSRTVHASERGTVQIGINMMVVSTPSTYITSKGLSEVTGEEISKIEHFGVHKQRLPTLSQSNVTMVADAIYLFIKRVSAWPDMEKKFFKELPKAIYFGTESNDDYSRPEAAPALGMTISRLLNEDAEKYKRYANALKNIEIKQVTFACAGGGLSISDAVDSVYTAASFGRNESAIVITADTAVYNPRRARNAEKTQGSAAALMWITKNPELVDIKYSRGYGRFSMPLSDFTKFGNCTPIVHGEASNIGYVYAVAKAVEDLEAAYSARAPMGQSILESRIVPKQIGEMISGIMHSVLKKINEKYEGLSFADLYAFISHVPYPKQAKEGAGYLFVHYLKRFNPKLYDQMQKRQDVGKDPLAGKRLTDLITEKLSSFGGDAENGVISYLESDKDIKEELKWIKKVMKQPEFGAFLNKLHIDDALDLPSKIGNSYTTSLPVALASLLRKVSDQHHFGEHMISRPAVLVFYGSGLVAKAFVVEIKATQKSREHIIISTESESGGIELLPAAYTYLHSQLILGDAFRTITTNDLTEQNRDLLGGKLPKGFNLVRRHSDGTWESVFVNGAGVPEPIRPRF
jgi:3-hydroxy-3-methylglutaryl CoA synthase